MKTTKKKPLTYDDIKLNHFVQMPFGKGCNGLITQIENNGLPVGIDEPVFSVTYNLVKYHFGLKYILKYYITD